MAVPSQAPSGLLEIGLTRALHVRQERMTARTDACRLLYVSDIHLRNGRSERICRQLVDAVARTGPDAILLGGDLVDMVSELGQLSDLIRRLRDIAPVLAVGGNHDEAVGLNAVRAAVAQGGGRWIHQTRERLRHGTRVIEVSGPNAIGPANHAGDVRVLCAHNPRIWKTVRGAGYDVVLAGHLHGCQMVVFEYRNRLFPGTFLYPYCFLSHRSGPTRLVVSRGVSDRVPVRWNCPRELVLCHV